MEKLYFEDFAIGQVFRSGTHAVTADAIKAFAAEFDPQPFHLDEAAAAGTMFKGLAASGWHTMAMTMRLIVDGGLPIAGGVIGAGVDELRWHRPVRPGDVLMVESEVIETKLSSRPGQARMRVRCTTRDQHGEAVQSFVPNLIVPLRPVAGGSGE